MIDLTVEIPKKYKKALIERFSLKNAGKIGYRFEINKQCPLCSVDEYHSKDKYLCGTCPFAKFEKIGVGCVVWAGNLLKYSYHFHASYIPKIWWDVTDDKEARKELKLLKKKARKLIKWV